ncbi:MAG: hypothetical protein Q9209_001404 [Squamulea sp. 1 TL-2023]
MDRQTALLEWVNSFTLSEDVVSLSELADGFILWDILRDVDPTYFTNSLPETRGSCTKWIPRYENLKHLHKSLASYISEECDQALFAPRAGDGLQAIAKDASVQHFLKLFQLVLQATISSPRQQEYILKMTSLTDVSKKSLKELIEDREDPEESDLQQSGVGADPSTFLSESELEMEERYGKVLAHNKRMLQERKEYQDQLAGLNERLLRLQESYDIARQDLVEAQDQLQIKASVHNGTASRSVKELQAQIQQQENDFADQETRMAIQDRKLAAALKKIANLEASTNALTKKARDAQDELDVVKKEGDASVRKANTAEKFKQQLQASKKEIGILQSRLEDYQKDDADFEDLRHENVGLRTQIEEFKKLVSRIEEDNAESFRIRGQLQLDIEALHRDVSSARKLRKQDQATIAQLKHRVRSSSVSSVGSHDNADVEAEFQGIADKQVDEKEIASDRDTQLEHLTNTVQEQASTIDSLQRQLDEVDSRPKPDEEARKPSNSPPNSTESTVLKTKYGTPELNGIAQPAYSLISIGANTAEELKDLRSEVKRLRKQLQSRLLDQHSPLPDHPKLTPEIKDLVAKVANGSVTVDDNVATQEWCRSAMMEGREQIIEAEKIVEQQKSTIANLEERLKDAEASTAVGAKEQEDKPLLSTQTELQSLHEENTNLKRELRLMSSAFHGLAARHQYSGITVQRKAEAPSSWLGKQRRIVEGNLGGSSSVGGARR